MAGLDIQRAISRFEVVVGAAWPEAFGRLQAGLDDDGMERLAAAVAPYRIPGQIDALYRWRGGGDGGVFGGWRIRPLDELIEFYRFTCDELDSPRTWLPVFDDQMISVVTLDISGEPESDHSVWYAHTHDATLSRMFNSVAALLHVVCDATDAGVVAERAGRLLLQTGEFPESLDGLGWSGFRLARRPGSFRYPDPPPGTELERFPETRWPREWLLPLGITEESLALRGATHTIAELVAAAAEAPVEGTIRGRVIAGSGDGGFWNPVVSDGTGEIVVSCERRVVPITGGIRDEVEFDVVLDNPDVPPAVAGEDSELTANAHRFLPPLPRARAVSARPIESS